MSATVYYDKDANLEVLRPKTIAIVGYGSQGHAQAQNLRDNGFKVLVAEVPGTHNFELAAKHGFKPMTAAEASQRRRHRPAPDAGRGPARRLLQGDRPEPDGRQGPGLLPRVQHPLRPDRPAQGRRRLHGRAQGAGASRPPGLRGGRGRSRLVRRRAGRDGQGPRPRHRPRLRHRLGPGGDPRDDLQGRDRDRPLRRAGRPLRRRLRARQGRVRDADRGRLPARDRLLRVHARAEAHRRPPLPGRPELHEIFRQRHRRVRRLPHRQAHRQRGDAAARCRRSSPRSATAASPATGSWRTRPTGRTSGPAAGRSVRASWKRSAASSGRR